MKFVAIPAGRVAEAWHAVEPLIAAACARGIPKYRPADIFGELVARNMQLWAGLSETEILAVCVTEIVTYPLAKVCRIMFATGRDPAHMIEFMPELETWARAEGCTSISANARPGWERFLRPGGYEKTHVMLEKPL